MFTLVTSLVFFLVARASFQETLLIEVFAWTVSSSDVRLIVFLDFFSGTFLAAVSLISLSVYIFSSSYMKSRDARRAFHLLVLLFVASIYLLIISPGVFSIMLG